MAKFEYMERAFSSELRPRARLVLQVLVLHCNKEGECFPSIKTIAAKCGYGISTVKRALDELVEAGYIIKQARFERAQKRRPDQQPFIPFALRHRNRLCRSSPQSRNRLCRTKKRMKLKMPFPLCLIPRLGSSLPSFCSLPIHFSHGLDKIKTGRQKCRPDAVWTGGQSILYPLEPYR